MLAKRLGCLLLGGVLAAILATAGPRLASAADLGAKDETIKLAINEWTGQHVTTHIAGQLLQKMGYKVEYVTAGNYPQFEGLSDGSISATLEVWMNNVGDIFPKALESGKIVDLGALGLKTNATKHSIFRAVKKMRQALEPFVAQPEDESLTADGARS